MFSSVIVHVAFGLELLMAAGQPSPMVVGQAAGQISARNATDRAEASVATTLKALKRQNAQVRAVKTKHDAQLAAIKKLNTRRASWNRDRKIRKAKTKAHATGKRLASARKDVRRLRKLLRKQRRRLVAATDRELNAQPGAGRRAELIGVRTRAAAKLIRKPKRKARKIIIPDVDEFADPEELEEQAALLLAAERQLVKQEKVLRDREAKFEKMARLRSVRDRSGELTQLDSTGVRRTTGRVTDKRAEDRGNNEAGAGASADADGQADPSAPPSPEPGGGDENFDDGNANGGFGEPSVVLADVVDSSTVRQLRRAERSTDPGARAKAAKKARAQVAERLKKIRALRKKIQDRAKKLRK